MGKTKVVKVLNQSVEIKKTLLLEPPFVYHFRTLMIFVYTGVGVGKAPSWDLYISQGQDPGPCSMSSGLSVGRQ